MYSSIKKLTALTALSLVAFLAVGVATASAHGSPGRAGKKANTSALVTQAAKQLDVTRAKLVSAIEAAAVARIDQALEDEDIDADEAVDLKEEALDNLRLAMQLSHTKAVASNLGITSAQLNGAFRAARKALAIAQIDKALAAGKIDADEAAEQKADLEDTDYPGYNAGGLGLALGQQDGCSGGGRR
jgi:hypothetical protein